MLTYRSTDVPTGLDESSLTATRETADPGASLIIDVDAQTVRGVVIDSVEGESRFIASAEVPSTTGPPVDDLAAAVKSVIALLELQTGIKFGDSENNKSKFGPFALTGFPVPPLNLAIVPTGGHPLVPVLALTSWSTPSSVQILTDDVRTEDGVLSATLLELRLRALQPDIVVLLQGNQAQAEWASAAGAFGSLMADGVVEQLIVLSSDEFQQYLIQTLGEEANMMGLDPNQYEYHEVAMALETELNETYEYRVSSSLRLNLERPFEFVSRLRSGELATRYIARRLERSIVGVDVSSGIAVTWSNPHSGGSITRPDIDVHANIRSMFGADMAAVRAAMPIEVSREELSNWILNRAVRPRVVSSTDRDQITESVLMAEAVATVWKDLDDVVNDQIDLIIAGPSFCFDLDPALGILTILDAFQPAPLGGFVQIVLDPDGLMWSAGAIGSASPAIASESIDSDLLTPAATVVVVEGTGVEGQSAVTGRLTYEDGESVDFDVPFGTLLRLPLGDGDQATLVLTCEAGFAVGGSNPGEQMQFGPEDGFIGGEVGVIIDARGRPITATADDMSGGEMVRRWYSDLDIDW